MLFSTAGPPPRTLSTQPQPSSYGESCARYSRVQMPVDPRRTISDLEHLRTLTANDHGAQRIAWTETWLKARAWFQAKLAQLPAEHHLDAAGNSWTTLRGDSD